jgi:hypothetical protein
MKIIAYYLPQFHPIKENNMWWGEGFTEWVNVAKARPLYKGHYQPKIPSDLGFYDLRLPESREAQAQLAKEAGIAAFCYWHYWFGNGKQLLEKPLQEVVKSGKPDFPFCIAWANHSWQKKDWNSAVSRLSKETLIEQLYPGEKDVDAHFYSLLPVFKDKRYYKLNNRLVFVLYDVEALSGFDYFINRWKELASENGLPGFFFIGHTTKLEFVNSSYSKKLDAINLHFLNKAFNYSKISRLLSWLFNRPSNVISYSKAMYKWENDVYKNKRIYPCLYPNWDTTPRRGAHGDILHGSTPELFKKHVKRILDLISQKEASDKVVFLKSWNEWAEGNYMEPDQKYGKGYIKALKSALSENGRDVL